MIVESLKDSNITKKMTFIIVTSDVYLTEYATSTTTIEHGSP